MSKKTLNKLTVAAAIVLQLAGLGTAMAALFIPRLVKLPVPVSGGGTDKKMADMQRDTCTGGGNEWLCTGKDGHTYGCTVTPDRCQRL